MANRDRNSEGRWQELNRQHNRFYAREHDLGDKASNRDQVWQDIRNDESQGRRMRGQNRQEYQQGYPQGSRGQQNREGNWANAPYYSRYETGRVYDWDDRYNENWEYNNWMGPYYGIGPKNYQRSDQNIEEDINERLTRHGQVDATDINVQVKDGEVTLEGVVKNRGEKRIAERVVDSVSGVRDMINNLKVQNI